MNKWLLDSNIIIGLAKSRLPLSIIENSISIVSEITRLEAFGYHKLQVQEEKFLKQFFDNITCLNISKLIIDQAIRLRKEKAMSVGDAIIAATAITQKLPLITANTKDFKHIENLELINPVEI